MPKFRGPRSPKRKFCKLCFEKVTVVDYKDDRKLQRFLTDHGKIVPRRISGVCAPHQWRLSDAIKKARNIALLPFAASI